MQYILLRCLRYLKFCFQLFILLVYRVKHKGNTGIVHSAGEQMYVDYRWLLYLFMF